jgi:hypothetical protein
LSANESPSTLSPLPAFVAPAAYGCSHSPFAAFCSNILKMIASDRPTLTHLTTVDQLSISFKCIALHYKSRNLVTKMIAALEALLESLERIQRELREAFSDLSAEAMEGEHAISAEGILEFSPRAPFQDAVKTADLIEMQRPCRSICVPW